MSWFLFDYNLVLKTHIVHDSVIEIAQRDVEQRHNHIPVSIEEQEDLHIDPGGMICLKNSLIETEIVDGSWVSVRPELILNALYVWNKSYRVLDEKLPDGENVIKVYYGSYHIAVMPESIYQKIGAWLTFKKSDGYVARLEIVEALAGAPNILVLPPPTEGDA